MSMSILERKGWRARKEEGESEVSQELLWKIPRDYGRKRTHSETKRRTVNNKGWRERQISVRERRRQRKEEMSPCRTDTSRTERGNCFQ